MIILGSGSDYKVAEKTTEVLEKMQVKYDIRVASAHRTHKRIKDIVLNNSDKIEVFIAIAGLAAHLPGIIASYTTKPVIAVPVNANLEGMDALLSSIQMQLGTPVATMGIDRGDNAAWLACQIIACDDENLREKLVENRKQYDEKMQKDEAEVISKIAGEHYQRTKTCDEIKENKCDKTLIAEDDTKILILSGNYSNIDVVHKITQTLDSIGIKSQYKVVSATRTPEKLEKYIRDVDNQIKLYIVVSNLSTILAGAVVSLTTKPVIGVPCNSSANTMDSLLSMIQMPPGVPTATMGINAGENAALYAAGILSIHDKSIQESLDEFIKSLHRNNYYE